MNKNPAHSCSSEHAMTRGHYLGCGDYLQADGRRRCGMSVIKVLTIPTVLAADIAGTTPGDAAACEPESNTYGNQTTAADGAPAPRNSPGIFRESGRALR